MKYIFAAIAFLAFGLPAFGKEALSFLYIQGDKQTPFYVKLEEAMQPRFGKNYCIIPQLASGPAHIEILFQQNTFPPQQFTVLIPEGGSRGFLLIKKDEGFALYDLQQDFYLQPGNTEGDDHLPATGNLVATNVLVPNSPIVSEAPAGKQIASVQPKKTVKKEKPAPKQPQARKPLVAAKESEPVKEGPAFIPGMELSKATINNGDALKPDSAKQALPVITNSDCPAAISSADFSKVFSGMSANGTEEERLSYVLDKMDVCYESWQARALAQMLSGDAARFTLLKRIFPRIKDQGSFPLLDDLLTSETWKTEFGRLIHH